MTNDQIIEVIAAYLQSLDGVVRSPDDVITLALGTLQERRPDIQAAVAAGGST